jgi:hypothetical protein
MTEALKCWHFGSFRVNSRIIMKTFSLLTLTIQLGLALTASALDPTTIETVQGKTFQQCKILKRDPDGVSFSHSKGVAKVLYSDLSSAMRNSLGYDAVKADAYEKEHAEARKEAAQAKRERETKLAEAMIAAQARYAAQQPMVFLQQPNGSYLQSLAPVLGLGRIGVPNYAGGGHHGHKGSHTGGWSNPGISTIVPGTGGVYVPQGNGTTFYGLPGVNYSPTLGYTTTNNSGPVFFGQQSNGIVPGVSVSGSSTFVGHHH